MTGTIDWNDVFDALDEINYQGTYNVELNLCHFGKKFAGSRDGGFRGEGDALHAR